MKANVVLCGGGAKGAVLAGCVNAALSKGVEPAGFGGTSAGAIVAFLAAIGYRGDDLKRLLVDTPLASLLDDGGDALERIAADLGWVRSALASGPPVRPLALVWLGGRLLLHEARIWVADVGSGISRGLRSLLARVPGLGHLRPEPRPSLPERWSCLRLASVLLDRLGLHDGQALRGWLVERLVERGIASADEAATLSLAELATKPGCVPLRIVATDVRSRQPVVFGRHSRGGMPVVDAVVASARFPLLFRPEKADGARLTDGGLSSNLPAFLFEDAFAATRTRTIAFDLVEAAGDRRLGGEEATGIEYLLALASCAVEASDVLLRRSTAGVEYYAIPVPEGIGVLSFRIDSQARHACYDRGFSEASAMIDRSEWYVRRQLVGEGLQARLIAEHGSPDLLEPVLRALMDQLSSTSDIPLDSPRASISLVVSRGAENKRIVTYSLGMDRAPDSDLELAAGAGCSGRAWEECAVAVADVQAGRERPAEWGMTAAQYAKIPRDVRTVISVPILDDRDECRPGMHPLGVISVDCRTSLAETGWIEESDAPGGHKVVDGEVEEIIWAWARVVHALLRRAT